MCGIFGALRRTGEAPEAPLDALTHRGPDGRGEWRSFDRTVVLGHTRLAIVDLSPTGAQPMIDEKTGNVVVFNGEIFNHRQIRSELGYRVGNWRGTSDTETLLRAYGALGPSVLENLKGMFAFAIYDAQRDEIIAARDRLGIKPLYYVEHEDTVLLASEARALLDLVRAPVTRQRVAAYLRTGACPDDEILFQGVDELAAGHSLVFGRRRKTELTRYWNPAPSRRFRPQPAREVRRLLENAVSEHLLSDVPVASFLSGGIDSSIVTALAAKYYPGSIATFAVGFSQPGLDETAIAEIVARRYRTDHTRIFLPEDEVIVMVQEAVAAMDLPSVDAINTYVVSKAVARTGIKVALSGLGGDELFGGYPSFRDLGWLRWAARLPGWGRGLLFALGGATGRRLAEVPATGEIGTLAAWRRAFWTDAMLARAGLPPGTFHGDPPPPGLDTFGQISWAELTQYMRCTLLRDSDQMSMAAGLELRVPFLDHDLVEFVLRVPEREKTGPGGVKPLLVAACRDLLPPEVHRRRKMGFVLPMDEWMRGPLADFVRAGRARVVATGLVRPEAVEGMAREFAARRLHWTRLWALVVLGHYLHRRSHSPALVTDAA